MKHSILVVEDNTPTRLILNSILRNAGYQVTVACDGLDGIAKLDQQSFDLVISDLQMPNMDGLTFARELRKREAHARTPFIMLTAQTGEKIKRQGEEVDVHIWVMKPLDPDALVDTVNTLLQISKQCYAGDAIR